MTSARILVVDDEADINTILSVTLRRAGYEVISTADGLLPLFERERALGAQALADRLTEDVLERAGARLQDDMTVFVLKRS